MARLEYKYYIPDQYLDELRRDCLPYLNYDKFTLQGDKKEYTVKSVYLDSPKLHTYEEKLSGTKRRNKYRIRGYNFLTDKSIVFLEIKRKEIDYVSKDRAILLYRDLENFFSTKNFALLACSPNSRATHEASARNFLYYYYLYQLRPTSIVTYDREAFECKFNTGLRVTFDKNIRAKSANSFANLFSEEDLTPSLKGYFVLELKYNRLLPIWLPRIMNKYNVFRDSASKYQMSIDTTAANYFI